MTARQLVGANASNWILVRLHHAELLLPRYLYYLLQHRWMQGMWSRGYHAGKGSTSRICVTVREVASIVFQGQLGLLQLRQLATVKRLNPRSQLQPDDIVMRRCSGSARLVGEPFYVRAA